MLTPFSEMRLRLLAGITSPKDAWTLATWNRAYDDAMQWRDWQECERLLEERELESWWPLPEDEEETG